MLRRTHRRLYLSPSSVVLAEVHRHGGLAVLESADLLGREPLVAIPEVISQWSPPKSTLASREIVVDDLWCRYFMVRPPRNAATVRDLAFAAANRFQSLYDETPMEWAIEADWNATSAFVACAIYRPLLAAIEQSRISGVASLVPRTLHYCARHKRRLGERDSWLIAAGAKRMVVTVFRAGAITDVHQMPLTPVHWGESGGIAKLLKYECLRLNQPPPQEVVLCGDVPPEWHTGSVDATGVHVEREALRT